MAITEHTDRPRFLVAGCGALGGEIALRLSQKGDVYGLRRTASAIPAPVQPIGADLFDPAALQAALESHLAGPVDAAVYCLTPPSYDEAGYQAAYVTGLANLLAALDTSALKRLIFISSTSVYSQNQDEWVDEDSPTEPDRFSGKRILEGEALACSHGLPGTVVRLSGIYGPTRRRFLEAVRNGRMAPRSPGPFSNRIHEHDAAEAVVHLLDCALAGEPLASCYLASDDEPVRLDDVVSWVRRQVTCAAPAADARTGGRAGSKRCSNRRLKDTGFVFRYPDFRSGYREMIDAEGNNAG